MGRLVLRDNTGEPYNLRREAVSNRAVVVILQGQSESLDSFHDGILFLTAEEMNLLVVWWLREQYNHTTLLLPNTPGYSEEESIISERWTQWAKEFPPKEGKDAIR